MVRYFHRIDNQLQRVDIMMKIPKLAVLEQEMDRKDFLKYLGVGAMLLLGGNMIIGALTGINKAQQKSSGKQVGYGDSKYGG